ncbi:uncharacterized protein LOC132540177 [Erinaceus europaeus]|uniref:Uncharacterized protein LOC132540177 n=1 Tax=Erinaceus europaeus TaxID=9365 RepID=A0ABM3XVT8_ERIEU|nr:uncharacterized protein LOC132540177 [Erinaceus europaeus]
MPHKAVDEAPVTKKFVTQHIMIPVPQMPYNPSGMVTIPKDEDHKAKEELCSKQNSARSRKQRQQQLPTIYEDPEIEVSGAEDELYPLQDSAETSQQLKLQAVAHVAVAQEELCLLQGSAKSSQHRQLLQAIAKTPGTQDHKAKEEMCPLQTSVEESQQQKLQVTDETPQAEICKAVEKVYPLKYFAEESRQQQLKAVNAPPQVQDHQFKKEPFPLQCSAVATEQHLKTYGVKSAFLATLNNLADCCAEMNAKTYLLLMYVSLILFIFVFTK